jgi:hypothetical protein
MLTPVFSHLAVSPEKQKRQNLLKQRDFRYFYSVEQKKYLARNVKIKTYLEVPVSK